MSTKNIDNLALDYYYQLNGCNDVKEAFRYLCDYIRMTTPMHKISVHLFEKNEPFIKESFEMTKNSKKIESDVRSYMTPKNIDTIRDLNSIELIKIGSINIQSDNADHIIPLVYANDRIGFILIKLEKNTPIIEENILLQLVCNFAFFLSHLCKTTQLIEKEHILHETKQYVSNILENMVHGVISIDSKGVIKTFSKGAEILLELESENVVSQHFNQVFPPQISQLIENIKQRLSSEKYIVESEAEFIMQDKFPIPIKFTASLLKDKKEKETGLILVCKDSSSVKRLIALQELRNMKSEFLATASHEFKTPLNLIMGSVGILAEGMIGDVNEKQLKLINLVQEGGNRLHNLIKDLLDISKIDQEPRSHTQDLNIREVLDENLNILKEVAGSKNINITTVFNENDLTIFSTKDNLYKIFNNLISNAIKYTPENGKIHISVKLTSTSSFPESFYRFDDKEKLDIVENAIEIIVSDTGIGIEEKDKDTIFQQFKRLDNQFIRQTEGTGLGLFITKKIVNSMGGTIRVKSIPNHGSMFIVQLPINPIPRLNF